jgi:hypothetical protein
MKLLRPCQVCGPAALKAGGSWQVAAKFALAGSRNNHRVPHRRPPIHLAAGAVRLARQLERRKDLLVDRAPPGIQHSRLQPAPHASRSACRMCKAWQARMATTVASQSRRILQGGSVCGDAPGSAVWVRSALAAVDAPAGHRTFRGLSFVRCVSRGHTEHWYQSHVKSLTVQICCRFADSTPGGDAELPGGHTPQVVHPRLPVIGGDQPGGCRPTRELLKV